MLPSFVFYKENPIYISRFFEAPSHFNPREKEFIERGKNVLDSFIKLPMGGMFKWQTGNSYKDFVSQKIPVYEKASSILVLFFVLSLVFEVYLSIKNKDAKRGVVVAWTSCALWYLNILWTIDLVPRYFLLSIPPAMLLISIFINDIFVSFGKNIYLKLIIYFLPLTISLYWLLFNIYYNHVCAVEYGASCLFQVHSACCCNHHAVFAPYLVDLLVGYCFSSCALFIGFNSFSLRQAWEAYSYPYNNSSFISFKSVFPIHLC